MEERTVEEDWGGVKAMEWLGGQEPRGGVVMWSGGRGGGEEGRSVDDGVVGRRREEGE